ncbi:extracellular SCP domain-containing protein Pry1, partial [Amylocarpus encephaloides]
PAVVKPEVKAAAVVTKTSAAPVIAPAATQAAAVDSFEGKMIADHNHFRAQHGVSDLVWNATLASQSADNANKCVFAHSGQQGAGENIAAGSPLSVATTVNMWALERTQYDFANGGFSSATGHFTQVAWKDTTSVGCAQKTCDGQTYITCRYYPAGNYAGEFQNNVFKQV